MRFQRIRISPAQILKSIHTWKIEVYWGHDLTTKFITNFSIFHLRLAWSSFLFEYQKTYFDKHPWSFPLKKASEKRSVHRESIEFFIVEGTWRRMANKKITVERYIHTYLRYIFDIHTRNRSKNCLFFCLHRIHGYWSRHALWNKRPRVFQWWNVSY